MRRKSIWVPAIVVAIAAGLLVGGTAFGDNDPTPKPVTADEYYTKGMTLEEISAASEGKPGEIIPPCPAADIINQLKEQGLPSGPCDPLPEDEPMILPLDEPEPTETPADETCPKAFLHSTEAGDPNLVEAPCGPGATMDPVDVAPDTKDGRPCVKVTYRTAANEPWRTDVACVGDRRDPKKPFAANTVED